MENGEGLATYPHIDDMRAKTSGTIEFTFEKPFLASWLFISFGHRSALNEGQFADWELNAAMLNSLKSINVQPLPSNIL